MSTAQTIAMITGAAGNLGRAVAQAFADDGARLILVDHNLQYLRSAFPHAASDWELVEVDLTSRDAVDKRLGKIVSDIGRVDALCAIAGAFRMGEPVHETTAETWTAMMDINVRTFMNAAHTVVPGMIANGRGRIVTVGAAAARQGLGDMGAYIAAKSAVMRLTESMAAELGSKGINVNCVLPGTLDTPQNRSAMPDADPKKWVNPNDLAAVIRFLASDQAIAINGALIPVTGRG